MSSDPELQLLWGKPAARRRRVTNSRFAVSPDAQSPYGPLLTVSPRGGAKGDPSSPPRSPPQADESASLRLFPHTMKRRIHRFVPFLSPHD
ncbi:hypothetical protein C8R44DRAFT_866160 [Mycena epipterygia]|nr:hypothetical protein C8R44DRAFT_866160 [Mycena epipterygia]